MKFNLLTGMILACVLPLAFMMVPDSDETSADSVVLIHTEGGSGYGVAWGGDGRIVTALHLVAGKKNIQINWNNQTAMARVEKIHQPADLALLRLDKVLPIPQLTIYPGTAPLRSDINYWEKKATSSSRMDNKTTKLERVLPLQGLNPRLDANAFAKSLCTSNNSNYPALATQVFKFEEANIKKSHSGSPLTVDGRIIGMVDGGDNINAKSCVWAIPASEFNVLLNNGTVPALMPVCNSEKLYSGLRSDNPFLTQEEQQYATVMENSENAPIGVSDGKFSLSFIAPLEVILDNMFEEDKDEFKESIADDGFSEQDFFDELISVYQDDDSGATILLPYHADLKPVSENGLTYIQTQSPNGFAALQILVLNTANFGGNAKDIVNQVRDIFLNDQNLNWQRDIDEDGTVDEDVVDDFLEDEDDPYYALNFYRVAKDDDNQDIAEIYGSLAVENTNFLGVSVQVANSPGIHQDRNELRYYYLLELCANMTDFAYY